MDLPVDDMKKAVLRTKMYHESWLVAASDPIPAAAAAKAPSVPRIRVVEGDCLEAGLALKARGLHPIVLNMANGSSPGGGYLSGSGAQEENLHRRSDYCNHLDNPFEWKRDGSVKYPMSDAGGECVCMYVCRALATTQSAAV